MARPVLCHRELFELRVRARHPLVMQVHAQTGMRRHQGRTQK